MFGAWVTTNVSQRIVRRPVHRPAPVTFNLSQLAPAAKRWIALTDTGVMDVTRIANAAASE